MTEHVDPISDRSEIKGRTIFQLACTPLLQSPLIASNDGVSEAWPKA